MDHEDDSNELTDLSHLLLARSGGKVKRNILSFVGQTIFV